MAEPSHPPSRFLLPSDTIVALATVPGRGAIALIRLSGPQASEIARCAVRPWPATARVATLCEVHSSTGERLDQAVVTRYESPRSFTGEDVVEIACHGGWGVPTSVLPALVRAGAREALPGEFTRRAVLNGKLDVLQAEAVGDLVDARSRGAQRAALNQLDGGLSRRVLALRESLLELEALIAYDIDFPEEDDGPVAPERILTATNQTLGALDDLLATLVPASDSGGRARYCRAPNVGKSSFQRPPRSPTSDRDGHPVTTRDALEAVIDSGSWPIRWSTRPVARDGRQWGAIGVEVSEDYLARADAVLACGDDAETLEHASRYRGASDAPFSRVDENR